MQAAVFGSPVFYEVLSLTVPAGSYLIAGKLFGGGDYTVDSEVGCLLSTGDGAEETWPPFAGNGFGAGAMSFLDVATFAETTTIAIRCQATNSLNNGTGGVDVEYRVLTATKISAIH